MKKLLVLVAALIIASCSSEERAPGLPGADGYVFEEPTILATEFKVQVVLYKSTKELRAEGRSYGADNPSLMAFAILEPPLYDKCTIHIVDPKYDYQPEWYGHELTHCIYGQWHK
jgi:hypothetical protein